eukprot:TRINITY_DN7680_c0_g5_i1.p1 TRINITY_DN7680_c0_g5~~TRINITY_DN7680_c0_g5_i1.p1  ORF type:complete len:803 (-),score=262.51 TRINITY_DN7680_c0_g5_i1:82-2490(-)
MFSKFFGGGSKDSSKDDKSDDRKKALALGLDPSLFEDPKMDDEGDEDFDESAMHDMMNEKPKSQQNKKQPSPATTKAAPAKKEKPAEVDFHAMESLGNEEVEVGELTDADMNDPDLLNALREIEGDEEEAVPDNQIEILTNKVAEEKMRAIRLKKENRIEEAKQALLESKRIQAQLDALQNSHTTTSPKSNPTPAPAPAKKPVARPPPEPEPNVSEAMEAESEGETVDPVIQKMTKIVKDRLETYKKAALEARNQGDQQTAHALVKDIKAFRAALENLEMGFKVDLKKLPPDTPNVNSNTSNNAPNTTNTKSSTPQKGQKDEVEELRQQTWDLIEKELNKRVLSLGQQALRANRDGDKQAAFNALRLKKEVAKDLDALALLKSVPSLKLPPPSFHFEIQTTTNELTFPNLADHEMEVTIVSAHSLKPPANTVLNCYILCEVNYPESAPQKFQTAVVPGTDPEYNFTKKVQIERKKSFQRFVEKKKVVVQVWHSRFLLPDLLIGRGEGVIQPLVEKSEVICNAPIFPEGVRKGSFGSVEIRVRLRTPLLKKDIRTTEERALVLDSPIPLPGGEQTKAETKTETKTEAKTATKSDSKSESKGQKRHSSEIQKPTATTSTTTTTSTSQPTSPSSTTQIERPKDSTQAAAKKPATQNSPPPPTTTTTTTTSATTPSNKKEEEEEDDDEGDPDNIDNVISNEVLEFLQNKVNNDIAQLTAKKQPVPDTLVDLKQAIEIKANMLVIQVQTGALTMEKYTEMLQKQIEEENLLAKKLLKKGKREWAKAALHRAKLMKDEIESAANETDE